jgi:hypothetical protein
VLTRSESNQLQVESQLKLLNSGALPLSVDLEVDYDDTDKLWVLIGQNLRQLGKKVYDKNLQVEDSTPEQLVALSFTAGHLKKSKTINLPNHFVPFYISSKEPGNFYVSGINGLYFEFEENNDWNKKLKTMASMLLKSVKPGRILSINTETNEITTVIEGVGIYYHITSIPGKGPAFTLLKLSGTIWFPYINVAWGMGIQGRGTYSLRKLDSKVIFPPYSLGQISFQ